MGSGGDGDPRGAFYRPRACTRRRGDVEVVCGGCGIVGATGRGDEGVVGWWRSGRGRRDARTRGSREEWGRRLRSSHATSMAVAGGAARRRRRRRRRCGAHASAGEGGDARAGHRSEGQGAGARGLRRWAGSEGKRAEAKEFGPKALTQKIPENQMSKRKIANALRKILEKSRKYI